MEMYVCVGGCIWIDGRMCGWMQMDDDLGYC
jgi:hypothetical protein